MIHSNHVSVAPLAAIFEEIAPDVEVRHLVEEGLLEDVLAHGGVSSDAARRVRAAFSSAQASGSDVILSACSSVGEVADQVAESATAAIVKIDARMCERACESGRRIGVVATLETTLGPTRRLLEATALRQGREIEIEECLVEGAFEHLSRDDRDAHDRLLVGAIEALSRRVDVIVCAQGSMASVVSRIEAPPVPILTSPRLGARHAVELLQTRMGHAIDR